MLAQHALRLAGTIRLLCTGPGTLRPRPTAGSSVGMCSAYLAVSARDSFMPESKITLPSQRVIDLFSSSSCRPCSGNGLACRLAGAGYLKR